MNTFSDVNAFFGIGVGFSIRNASLLTRSGVGTAIGVASYGIEGSLRNGLESMKKRSPGCNNCTKGF